MKQAPKTEPSFYRKYSPHHELPLSLVIAWSIHVAVMLGLWVWVLFPRPAADKPFRPVKMDTVYLEDTIASGLQGDPGIKGGERGKTDVRKKLSRPKKVVPKISKEIPEVPVFDIKVPTLDPLTPDQKSTDAVDTLVKEVDDIFRKQAGLPPRSTGGGGDGGKGKSKGKGKGKQPGTGRIPTKQEVYAWRWRFGFMNTMGATGSAEHLNKLEAMGAVLLVLPQNGFFMRVPDLRRRPARTIPISKTAGFDKAVRWYLHSAHSVRALAKELRLLFPPKAFVILLPPKRAQHILKAELAVAAKSGRTEKQIVQTWFDFQLQNGQYIPVVQFQAYVDGTSYGKHPLAQ